MKQMELIAPCHFGLESVLKREIYDLGYEISKVEDGRVTFTGDEEAICRANINLRTTERILLKIGEFKADTFEELFEEIRMLSWEDYIPADGKFWVTKASSVKSKLFSPSDIQSIVKKAIVEHLKKKYFISWFSEEGAQYPIRIFIHKDIVTVGLDTTGTSLHKRGYRLLHNAAPISETLASALIMLTPWKPDRILVDPFCGSGTFPIEAAMMAANIAPGVRRSFGSFAWSNLIKKDTWNDAYEEAKEQIQPEVETQIQGYDIDPGAIKIARENARKAKVDHLIHFQTRPVSQLNHPKKYGFLITNPPYGERLEDQEALKTIYQELGKAFRRLDSWSEYLITSYEYAEREIGRKADKNRKLYNGMIKTYFYQYLGPKPPKRSRREYE